MAIGLDIGTGALRSARNDGSETVVTTQPAAVFPLEDGVDGTDALDEEQSELSFEHDGTTYLVGTAARSAARANGTEPVPLFTNGTLEHEWCGRALETLVAAVLDGSDATECWYTTPGTLVETDGTSAEVRETVADAVAECVDEATPIGKGFAVVYDQLGEDNYTGLGVCIESQTTSVGLSYYGVPVLTCSLARGSDWLVERAAAQTDHAPDQIASVLEGFTLDPNAATGDVENALARAHDELVADLIALIRARAGDADFQRGISVPVAVAGDEAIVGIEFLLGGRFDAASLPFSIRGVRLAENPAESPVRGALEAARDGVVAYEGVLWGHGHHSEQSNGPVDAASSPSPGAEAGGGTSASSSGADATLSFDDAARETERARSDDAITQLFERLGSRDDEMDAVVGDLEALESTVESIDETVGAVTADVESLADGLEDVSDASAKAEDVDALETRLEGVSGDLESTTEAVESTSSAVQELADNLESVESALDARATQASLTAVEDDVQSTLEAVRRLERTVESIAETADELEADVTALEADLSALESNTDARFSDAAQDRDELADSVSALEADLSAVEETIPSDDAFEAVRSDLDEAVQDVDTATAAAESVSSDLEHVTETVDAVESTLEGHATAIHDVEAAVDDQAASVRETEAVLEDHAAALESLSNDLETTRDAVATHENELSSLDDAVSALETDASERDDRIETSDERVATALERVESIESTLEERGKREEQISAADIEHLEERTTALAERLADVEPTVDSVATATERVDSLLDERERQSDRFEAFETEQSAQADRLETLASAVDDLDVQSEESKPKGNADLVRVGAVGGGSAGVVAGGTVAMTGAMPVGMAAVVLGFLALVFAFVAGNRA
ncbi:hypothetical protein [Natronosalvus rutilus]|uniref:Chromosome segregation ATPase n=1 Tax=Natronosalvus rutilus TaxID=2953753 RepID=A0A9E7N7M9_9EURY|nr:hypothetical protein [Natronosalvus rutilus]UTF52351.1 hypothetical protein NGM29_11170 [Natronosalvus rutilus]